MVKKIIKIVVAICISVIVVVFTNLPERVSEIFETFETKSSVSNIVGRWERDEGKGIQKLEFFSDGTYTSDHPNYNGNYSIDGKRLKLSGILVDPMVFSFDAKGNMLTLTSDNGEIRYYTKINN